MSLKLKCHSMSPKQRRAVIQDNILTHNYEELAKECGVTKRTIIRDVNKWRIEGGFEEFLYREFIRLYSKEQLTNQSKALDRIMYLIGKNITRHIETKTEITEKVGIIVKMYRPEENEAI